MCGPFFRPVFERLGCSLNLKELSLGTKVSHEGYPNYQSGDTCRVFPGNVTGTGSDNGQKFFNVSQPVVKGNSGGPVFDEFGQVVGIATKGITADDVVNILFNGCIPMHTIDRVIFIDF